MSVLQEEKTEEKSKLRDAPRVDDGMNSDSFVENNVKHSITIYIFAGLRGFRVQNGGD